MDLRTVVVAALCLGGCAAKEGPDPTQSSFTIKGTNPVADGKSKVTIDALLLDTKDAPVAGASITVSVSGSGNLIGQATLTNANGHATATIASTVAETKTVTVSVVSYLDGTLTSVGNKGTVNFVPGPPARLAFTTQPGNGSTDTTLPAPKVGIFDAYDNSLGTADPGIPVSLLLYGGTAGATLGGTTTQTSTVGEATFPDLTVSAAGVGYRLVAISSSLEVGAVSDSFQIQ